MCNAEIKKAMLQRLPVMCDGIEYGCILEYVLQYVNGEERKSAGLLDKNGSSIIRVPIEKVSLVTAPDAG